MAAPEHRPHIWGNICRLMRVDAPSLDAVQEKTGVGRGTVQRIRDGEAATRLSSLETIAKAFKVQVWQLLVPNLDPDKLPALAAPEPVAQSMDDLDSRMERAVDRALAKRTPQTLDAAPPPPNVAPGEATPTATAQPAENIQSSRRSSAQPTGFMDRPIPTKSTKTRRGSG